ncbi:MAG: hypothetical protein IH586_04715, partial [Anaerolineaceae bacterium]|nr:hypothetical protein [Anaerolineaceae bacterium]
THPLLPDLYALICEPWLRAWEWLSGTPDGFLGDVRRARDCAREDPTALGIQARAALCTSSVTSLIDQVPSDLVVESVEQGLISPALGLVYALKTDPYEMIYCVGGLLYLLDPPRQKSAIDRILSLARRILGVENASTILADCMVDLPEIFHPEVFSEIQAAVQSLKSASEQVAIWKELDDNHLPQEYIAQARQLHLTAIRAIPELNARLPLYKNYLDERAPEDPAAILGEALRTIRQIDDPNLRAYQLIEWANQFPADELSTILAEALDAILAITDPQLRQDRYSHLGQVSAYLHQAQIQHMLQQAILSQEDPYSAATALIDLAKIAAEGDLPQIQDEFLAAVRKVDHINQRVDLFTRAYEIMDPQKQAALSAEILQTIAMIPDPFLHAGYLIRWLADDAAESGAQNEVFAHLLDSIDQQNNAVDTLTLLDMALTCLPGADPALLLERITTALERIPDRQRVIHYLLILIGRLPESSHPLLAQAAWKALNAAERELTAEEEAALEPFDQLLKENDQPEDDEDEFPYTDPDEETLETSGDETGQESTVDEPGDAYPEIPDDSLLFIADATELALYRGLDEIKLAQVLPSAQRTRWLTSMIQPFLLIIAGVEIEVYEGLFSEFLADWISAMPEEGALAWAAQAPTFIEETILAAGKLTRAKADAQRQIVLIILQRFSWRFPRNPEIGTAFTAVAARASDPEIQAAQIVELPPTADDESTPVEETGGQAKP